MEDSFANTQKGVIYGHTYSINTYNTRHCVHLYINLFVMNTIKIIVLIIGTIFMLQVIIGIFSPILLFIFTLVFFLQAFRQ